MHELIGAVFALAVGWTLNALSLVSIEFCAGDMNCIELVVNQKKDESKDHAEDDDSSLIAAGVETSAGATQPNFGTDDSRWSNDDECDDPRFEGIGMAFVLVNEDRFQDASDCEELWQRGLIRLVSATGILGELGVGDRRSAEGRYIDRYRFVVPTGPSMDYQVDLRSRSLDTVLRLFAEDSEEHFTWNDDYRNDTGHSQIRMYLNPGTYSVEVSSYEGGEEGTYSLNVKRLTDTELTEVP